MSASDGRSSRAGHNEVSKPPLYVRALRLKHIRPGPWWCFLFFEGSLVLAGVLVLADWVSPWGLLVVPVGVAIAVKLNDVVTGALLPPGAGVAQARTTTATEAMPQLYSEADADCTWPAGDATAAGDEWATGSEASAYGDGRDGASAYDDGEATALVEADCGEANKSESTGHSATDSRGNQTAREDPVGDPATSDHLSADPASSGEDMSGSSVLDDSSADNPLADDPEEHNAVDRTSTVGSRDGNA